MFQPRNVPTKKCSNHGPVFKWRKTVPQLNGLFNIWIEPRNVYSGDPNTGLVQKVKDLLIKWHQNTGLLSKVFRCFYNTFWPHDLNTGFFVWYSGCGLNNWLWSSMVCLVVHSLLAKCYITTISHYKLSFIDEIHNFSRDLNSQF